MVTKKIPSSIDFWANDQGLLNRMARIPKVGIPQGMALGISTLTIGISPNNYSSHDIPKSMKGFPKVWVATGVSPHLPNTVLGNSVMHNWDS